MIFTDFKVGDRVRATRLYSTTVIEDTVTAVRTGGLETEQFYLGPENWTFELVERATPPVEEELLDQVAEAYYETTSDGRADFIAVVNVVRQWDAEKAA